MDPEARMDFHLGDFNVFERFFWTYGQLSGAIRTYRKYLRRIIIIDGTFLGGRSHGTLFTATVLDADNHLFPVGFAIAHGEKEENWHFFLYELREKVLVAG